MTTLRPRSGRPAGSSLVLGLDVGGTKSAALLVDDDDRVVGRAAAPTRHDAAAYGIVELARDILDRAEVLPGDLAAVGVGLPGHVDPAAGTVALAVNLDGLPQPIASVVEEALGVPCFIDHDARAAARWIARLDRGAHRSIGYVSIGTGISAGLVLDGVVVTGALGMAGEIGHLAAHPDGLLCLCGLHGCLETVASGPAIAREAGTMSAGDAFAAAAAGDARAQAAIAAATTHLARAIRGLVLTFGLDHVVVGGGVARAGAALMEPLLAVLAKERDESSLVRTLLADDVVRRQPADAEAGAWGAVTVARDGLRAGSSRGMSDREEVGRRDVTTQSG